MVHLQEDPRIVRTRSLIIEAFLELVQEKDFEAISVKDITERATINRATFYRHFPDKYLLLEHILDQMMENKGFEKLKEQPSLDEAAFRLLLDCFYKLIEALKVAFGRNYPTVTLLMERMIKDKLITIISTFIPLEHADQKKIVASMLVMSIHSATCYWISGNKSIPQEKFIDTVLPFLMGAVSGISPVGK